MKRKERGGEDKKGAKRPYRKPGLVCIDLVVDEVMGLGCKDLPGSAVGSIPCNNAGCSVLGS